MPNVTIKLSKTYSAHGEDFDTVELREPTYKDIFIDDIGSPFEWQQTAHGPVLVRFPSVVGRYVERLAVKPGIESLTQLNVTDSLALEGVINGFFLKPTTSTPPPDSSSSASESTQAA